MSHDCVEPVCPVFFTLIKNMAEEAKIFSQPVRLDRKMEEL
jgi:hypothetical protein